MEEVVFDDDDLIKDHLLRTLHRNEDGHLSASSKTHRTEIEHNVAVLYIYMRDGAAYTLHEYYVYSPDALEYRGWLTLVYDEIEDLEDQASRDWVGVYGWLTNFIRITPLRNGDLFIKIDKDGATGVRLAFSPREVKHETRNKKKAKAKSR